MRVTLTKDYRKLSMSYGLIQNISGDANVELTASVDSDGIILKPFQVVTVNRIVYARKISGVGAGALAILPFEDAQESDGEENTDTTGETDFAEEIPPRKPMKPPHIPHDPYACFEHCDFPHEPRSFQGHRPPPHDDSDGYVIKIPRELVDRGQNKFVVDFSH